MMTQSTGIQVIDIVFSWFHTASIYDSEGKVKVYFEQAHVNLPAERSAKIR
jgi:hypothetical protein